MAEDAAQGADGLALEAEPDVGVNACGDADVGVAGQRVEFEIDLILERKAD
ncbi:hypothetical protein [Streptomyces sp. NPDC017941]|uniref:hypothetical protein n=1 Tax=Streptomyces sp. NPDC017941 TaxID=3365018 RepID=UPI0037B01EBF